MQDLVPYTPLYSHQHPRRAAMDDGLAGLVHRAGHPVIFLASEGSAARTLLAAIHDRLGEEPSVMSPRHQVFDRNRGLYYLVHGEHVSPLAQEVRQHVWERRNRHPVGEKVRLVELHRNPASARAALSYWGLRPDTQVDITFDNNPHLQAATAFGQRMAKKLCGEYGIYGLNGEHYRPDNLLTHTDGYAHLIDLGLPDFYDSDTRGGAPLWQEGWTACFAQYENRVNKICAIRARVAQQVERLGINLKVYALSAEMHHQTAEHLWHAGVNFHHSNDGCFNFMRFDRQGFKNLVAFCENPPPDDDIAIDDDDNDDE